MKRIIGMVVLVGAVLGAVAVAGASSNGDDHVLRSKLIGNTPANQSTPEQPNGGPTLFGVAPAGAPWEVASSDVDVRRDGRVDVEVEGLVIAGRGTNGITAVTAELFCNGKLVDTTEPAPLSADGDFEIHETLDKAVPGECLVPALFISPAGRPNVYFAVTGS